MTYREFAERTLFSPCLEVKLMPRDAHLVDENPGVAITAPEMPGRPENLLFLPTGEHHPRPRAHLLEGDEDRAHLLHLFANHELLATELMALALLKFPDAPKDFRRGLVRTLQEEQIHTQWYRKRLAECGVEFGSQPVNGFFWRCISDMEKPLDYVSRLSLTFEQANLDFSKFFAQRFAEAGDTITAAILQQIYKDEIAHVGYGLKWFRRWQGAGVDEWQAFCAVLPFPLTPARAKGNVPFNVEGRRRAGLRDDFIQQLQLFSHSRGRTPSVHYFNPGAELCAATRRADATPEDPVLSVLTSDLETLTFFLAHNDDVALLHREPRGAFLKELLRCGISLPEREILTTDGDSCGLAPDSRLRTRKLGRLRPWGWSPDSVALLAPLREQSSVEPESPAYDEAVREIYSKAAGTRLLAALPWQESFGSREIIGTACQGVEETTAAMQKIWQTDRTAVIKASFGIAGRTMGRYGPKCAEQMSASDAQLLQTVSTQPGGCVVEPWLNRLADFSAHYEVEPGKPPHLKGLVRLFCADSGKFAACASGPQFSRMLPDTAARFSQQNGRYWLRHLYTEIIPAALQQWLSETHFRGMLGIDSFFYLDHAGQVRLKPIVEVNPRCTMGRTTLELRRITAPNRVVTFRIFALKALAKSGWRSLPAFAADLQRRHPLQLTAEPKIDHGAFFLNDPSTAEQFLATAFIAQGVELGMEIS